MGSERRRGADRVHRSPPRRRRVLIRLSDDEYARIECAAHDGGFTLAGFAAEATLAAAGPVAAPDRSDRTVLQDALRELMAARAAVNRYGGNVNQAVAALNATGERPEWLCHAVVACSRAVERVDAAVGELRRGLPL